MSDPNVLVSAYLDQDLSDEEASALTAWLRESPENVDELVLQSELHTVLQGLMSVSEIRRRAEVLRGVHPTDLRQVSAQSQTLYGVRLNLPGDAREDDDAAEPNPLSIRSYPAPAPQAARSRWHWGRWTAAAASLLIGSAIIALVVRLSARQSFDSSPVLLSRTIDARWTGTTPANGAALTPNAEFSLTAGYAELTFGGGAKVIVEGPSRFSVQSGSKVLLSVGKLSAVVPHPARGFAITTPGASIVDLGTEFGVCAYENGNTDVQVFRGSVQVGPVSGATVAADSITLRQGEARRVSADAGLASITLDDSTFVQPTQFDQWAKAGGTSPLDRWTAFSERFRRDPDLIAYYTFDKTGESAGKLANQSSLGESLDGLLGGHDGPAAQPAWGTGRWPDKGALVFGNATQQYVEIPPSAALDFSRGSSTARPFTVWAWVRGGGPNDAGIVTHGDAQAEQFALAAQIGSYRMWVRDVASPLSPYALNGSKGGALDGRWHFVAGVYDPSLRILSLFVDNRSPLVGAAPSELLRTSDPIRIGSRQVENATHPFGFEGTIDEVAVVGRAMSGNELQAIYESGKP